MAEKRNDSKCAVFVDAGIRVNTSRGCVSAWHYLRQRGTNWLLNVTPGSIMKMC